MGAGCHRVGWHLVGTGTVLQAAPVTADHLGWGDGAAL